MLFDKEDKDLMSRKKSDKRQSRKLKYLEIEVSRETAEIYQKVAEKYGISVEKLMGCVIALKLSEFRKNSQK